MHRKSAGKAARIVTVALLVMALGMTGCKKQTSMIDHVSFKAADSLESVRLSLVFAKSVKSTMAAGFNIKDYGYLFVNPATETAPFEIGFDLATSIVNDQDYVQLTPTTVMPNGIALPINYAVVQIQGENPISSKMDLYAYVDVLHGQYVGAAAIFKVLDEYFPEGLSVNQVFMRDHQGRPGVIASIFGPETDVHDGNVVTRSGGISVFANVKQLLGKTVPNQVVNVKASENVYLTGSRAKQYDAQPMELRRLESRLIEGLNAAH
jgi:hypothetical protein